ncbi:hypothetical protein GXW83_10810 [Streptacidiphilus sp. PB12-B1b]|uniref:hypothetical protein n=1 Tax=Streptacidiphilus sp. PB12-B1b TaxID=2705012 RepID=UPI0015F7AF89|nr:hypothetical protein [Streptacidiphilus sp. PB12-B1b]QMU76155.1 hypothetical protein GXW83_10810 [Streptacidiphilus sp. PB12-B1b]
MDSTGTASFGWRTPPAETAVPTLIRHVAPPHRIVLLLPSNPARTRVNPERHVARLAAMSVALPAGLFDGAGQCRVSTPDGRDADRLLAGLKAAADTDARSLIVYATGQLALGGDEQLYLTAPGLPLRLAHLLGVRWEWITHAIGRSVAPVRLLMVDVEADPRAWALVNEAAPDSSWTGVDRLLADGASLWGQVRPAAGRRSRGDAAGRSWAEAVTVQLRDGLPGAPAVLTPEILYRSAAQPPEGGGLALGRFATGTGSVHLRNRASGRGVLPVDALPIALQQALRRTRSQREDS